LWAPDVFPTASDHRPCGDRRVSLLRILTI
jgi:hypothetical protein